MVKKNLGLGLQYDDATGKLVSFLNPVTKVEEPVFPSGYSDGTVQGALAALGIDIIQPGRAMKIVTMGDSQNILGTTGTDPNKSYNQVGPMTWARRFTNQSIRYPIENNVAAGGSTWGAYETQMAAALALNPDLIMACWGVNDSVGGTPAMTLAKTKSTQFVKDCYTAGITPILQMIPPRGDAGGTVAALQWIEEYNRFLMDMVSCRPDIVAAYGIPAHKTAILISCERYPAYGATNGTCNPGMIGSDLLHKAIAGGVYEGYQIAMALNRMRTPSPVSYCSPYNKYDATNLPHGNLFVFSGVNRGMLQGTGGSLATNGGITPTGAIAPNTQLVAATNITSSGTTAVAYKENPRTDGLVSGEGQGIRLTSTGGGAAGTEVFQFKIINGVQGIRTGVNVGDTIVMRAKVKIKTAVGVQGINFSCSELGPASPRSYSDGGTTLSGELSSASSPEILVPFIMETPPMTIQTGFTDLNGQFVLSLNGVNPYDLDFVVYDWGFHKI